MRRRQGRAAVPLSVAVSTPSPGRGVGIATRSQAIHHDKQVADTESLRHHLKEHSRRVARRSLRCQLPARVTLGVMVECISHGIFLPSSHLDQGTRSEATDVAGVVRALDALAPGIGFYVCDERGRMRPHVNVFIGNTMVRDRRQLSDVLAPGDTVSILQALSGG
jgi:hypothetical protein